MHFSIHTIDYSNSKYNYTLEKSGLKLSEKLNKNK